MDNYIISTIVYLDGDFQNRTTCEVLDLSEADAVLYVATKHYLVCNDARRLLHNGFDQFKDFVGNPRLIEYKDGHNARFMQFHINGHDYSVWVQLAGSTADTI